MLTIEEIKKELDAVNNVELECVDSIGFLGAHHRNQSILKVGRLVVSSVDDTGVHLKDCFPGISPEELKYFRIKRPAPTFSDLIDVAVQAQKDGLLFSVNLIPGRLEYQLRFDTFNVSIFEDVANNIQREIDFINSLYTETFVMEDVSSFLKITEGIQSIVLANGCDITHRVYFDDNSLRFRDGWGDSITLTFDILKGATVTQKRGGL